MITSTTASTNAAIAESMHASSYRVKFSKEEFLELVDMARPAIIYHRGSNHFFAFDGFLMYCQKCGNEDFPNQKVVEVIELSNGVWSS